MQLSGGLVIAAIGWSLLNQSDSNPNPEKMQAAAQSDDDLSHQYLAEKAFYPFTFPITAGPGCIVVMLTLSARTAQPTRSRNRHRPRRLLLAAVSTQPARLFLLRPRPAHRQRISPSTAHGILRVMAFILLCIGVQIAWNGLSALLATVIKHA